MVYKWVASLSGEVLTVPLTATARKTTEKTNQRTITATSDAAELVQQEVMDIPVSVPVTPPDTLMNRPTMLRRAAQWAQELVKLGALKRDEELMEPKEVYCSTGIGDFTKIATWAQWYGEELCSDLANIDRKRFALLTVEQCNESYTFTYGLLHRDTGRIRHLFNLSVDQVGPRMRNRGLKIPNWFDVADLDHYRVG